MNSMIAIFSSQTSCSGDEHSFVIAVFTTQDKADLFLGKLKEYFPKEYFYISEYFAPKIDPDFTDFIMEGSHVVEEDGQEDDPEFAEFMKKLEGI